MEAAVADFKNWRSGRGALHLKSAATGGETAPPATAKRRIWDAAPLRGVHAMGRRVLSLRLFFFGLVGAAALAAAPAMAQVPCGPHAAILDHLAQRYGEKPHSIALTDQGSLIEVVVSPAGTWTILVTQPKGPSCIVATGKQWETVAATVEPGA
jgi:anti-sigma factor RsiW